MSRPGGWWRRKSTPAKFETYTRWSFHSFPLIEFVAVGGPVLGRAGRLGPGLTALLVFLIALHCALCAVSASHALDWLRGQREQPRRLMWALGGLTAVVAGSAVAIAEHGPAGRNVDEAVAVILLIVPAFGTGIVALGVQNRLRVLAFAAGATLGSLPIGMPVPAALTVAVAVLFGGGFVAFTSVFSVRLLNAVYELDEARETRTRLAVAEERLRFGRDLHDVMGRNLAVIALKSELAVQLAQRERPEAVTQMVEVQRLAHETQREVREVVRGYREADLSSELAGAKGVLTAAGIDCTVNGPAVGLPAQVQSALGWVVREAATNVLRHGDARRCAVDVRVLEGRAVLTVENDGAPDGAGGPGRGSGLIGLRERLAEIGGTLRAGPAGDGRFVLTAEVPSGAVPGSKAGAPGSASLAPAGSGIAAATAATVAPRAAGSGSEVTL
ncbi:sensor histidine kinase [Streptomyces chlorus]|uniref:Sensor histidine kinase n=1 Tax=Streptomyces chlorus TaxID=887452 RepID=A0ABW1DSX0_9ACTN